MKILITGVHGFVGSNLVKYLAPANEIYGLDIVAPEKEGVIKTYSWDDLDAGRMQEVDAIVHLAGKAHDTKNQAAAEVYFKVNAGLTQKMFDYFLAHSEIKKFVFFSTAKAAADKVNGVMTEEVVPAPVGPYGESKIAAERYILDVLKEKANQMKNRGVYIFRPCMIHGPGNKGNLNLLYNVVRKGIPWPLGAFENRRTFTSVENICFAVSGVLTKDVPSGIYNMGDDEALSTNELIEEICASLGKKAHIWRLPKGLMNCVARIGGWLHLPLNPERLRKLTENYISSNAKIKKALGVERMPVDAREGLKRTLESFR
ncbi:MAG: NAD-dependent epimerase/dehydratase family protein [Bacteroidales bacterium]|nr:NAD-dependent epimerase/dehydratase family protein [Bacteroidales bacterium]